MVFKRFVSIFITAEALTFLIVVVSNCFAVPSSVAFDTLGNVKYKRIFTYNNLWLPSHIESFQYQDKKEVAHSLETYTYKGKEVALRETVMNTSFDKKKTNVFKDITKFNHKDQKESISV
ncbi:MAG: hypothetical protein ACFNUV_10515 [Capnocytophaga endodontalis]